jgi:hypothetical protein
VWLCRCECGRTTEVVASLLSAGDTRSCGCLRRETTGAQFRAKPGCRGDVYLRLREKGWTLRRIAERFGVSFQTVSLSSRRAAERRSLAVRGPAPV